VSYSNSCTQYCLDWHYCHWDWEICSDRLVIWICTQACLVHLNFDQMPAKAAALPRISEHCLIFGHRYSISPRVSQCQMRLANMLHWIYLNVTHNICCGFSGAPELRSYASKCSSSATNPRAGVSYSHLATQSGLDWLTYQLGLPNMQHLICCNETHDRTEDCPVYQRVVEWCVSHSFDFENGYMASGFQCASNSQLTNDSKPAAASCLTSDLCLLSWDRPAGNV